MDLPLISTRNLVKTYELDELKLPVLKGINLGVVQGELVSIMGPSGCGKSTLLHLLGLLDTPTSGQIFFEGQNVSRYTERQRADFRGDRVGFVFQSFNLLKKFSALENVMLPLIYSRRGKGNEKRARKLLEQVGLSHRVDHLAGKLSGGESQRVAIARALINDPPLILADEPTGNLDSVAGAEIMGLLKDLNRDGKTIIVVTHDQNIAQNCQRTVRMKDGEVVGE